MMAVSVTTSPEFKASAPQLLWEGAYSHGSGSSCGMPGVASSSYDVSADGQRFILGTVVDQAIEPIMLVQNWRAALNGR